MSLILPSTVAPATPAAPTAPTPSGKADAKATARSDEQDQDKPGSFSEALARSLEPAGEKTDKPIAKTGTLATARRQTDPKETDTDDLMNLMALSLPPIESRMIKTAVPADAAATVEGTAPEIASALPTIPGSAKADGAEVLLNNSLAGVLAPASETIATATVSTNAQPQASLVPERAYPYGITSNGRTDIQQQASLVSGLTAASPKNAGQTSLQAMDAPQADDAEIKIDPLLMAGPTKDDAPRADLARVLPRGASKAAASSAVASTPENAAAPITIPPAGTDVTVSAALPLSPATAAVQTSGGIAASSAPNPTTTTTLVPEVGSNEWGKALSQQVVHMGNAGQQVAELQLNPPGLGPLKVTLSMNDQQIQAIFVSAHSSVRTAVEAALPQLRATLAENGISLGNTSVGAESQPQTAFSNGQDSQRERGTYRPAGMADTTSLLQTRTVTEPVRRNGGMRIDTYA